MKPFTDSDYESLDLRSGDNYPVWSPDGDRIAFISGSDGSSDIHMMNVDGSGVERLTEGHSLRGLSWSPDGERIVFCSYSGDIHVMDSDGSDVVQLTETDWTEWRICRFPSWSPDGERIAFQSDLDFGIYVMNPDGSGVERIGRGYMPAW